MFDKVEGECRHNDVKVAQMQILRLVSHFVCKHFDKQLEVSDALCEILLQVAQDIIKIPAIDTRS